MMSLFGFVLALGILVTVHEWGHYRVAVAFGVQVERFSIGFGRPLRQWVRPQQGLKTHTTFVISAIPLGGYVKFLDTREQDVPDHARPFAFDLQPLFVRAAIVLAGPVANLVLAVVLFAATHWVGSWQVEASLSVPLSGTPAQRAGLQGGERVRAVGLEPERMRDMTSVEALRTWWAFTAPRERVLLHVAADTGASVREVVLLAPVTSADPSAARPMQAWGLVLPQSAAVIRDVVVGGAAQRAGLQKGDRVVRINHQPIWDAAHLKHWVRDRGGSDASSTDRWEVVRSGHTLFMDVVLDRVQEGDQRIGRMGALLGEPLKKVWVDHSLFDAIVLALDTTGSTAWMTLQLLGKMLVGLVSWDQLGGPVAIAEMAGQSLHVGWVAFVSYLALLSVSLGVFNLLPIPMLDGGHLMYYLYEFIAGKAPPTRWLLRFQQTGFVALMALMAVTLFNDLHRLIG